MNDLGLKRRSMSLVKRGLKDAIQAAGYVEDKENPAYVVVGLDWQIDYAKICDSNSSHSKGCSLYRNQPWSQYPDGTWSLPGAGSLITLLEVATRVKPVYIGKPNAIIMDKAVEHLGLKREELLMVVTTTGQISEQGLTMAFQLSWWRQVLPKAEEVADLPIAPTHVVSSLCGVEF